jgi:hypothetical protein
MSKTALIVCGALAREVIAIKEKHGWDADLLGVSSQLHNRPEKIGTAVQKRIHEARETHDRVIIVYGDCGTGGRLDAVLAAEGVERISGPHCYEMYAGGPEFATLMAEEPGTYFLTDYLLRSFESLVIKGMGLDRYPQLRETYFHNYTRLLYLAQTDNAALREKAQWAADYLGLRLEIRQTGYGALESRLVALME